MDFKVMVAVVGVIILPLSYVWYKNDSRYIAEKIETKKQSCIYLDSVNIKCWGGENAEINIKGYRIFPNPCLSDDEAFKQIENNIIYSIIEKGDTLFVLSSNQEMFYSDLKKNTFLPIFNESTIKRYSKKHKYKVTKDLDPPFWTAIENKKDLILLELNNENSNQWVEGTIRDTILKLRDGSKIGINKDVFFKKMSINIEYKKDKFTIVLTNIYESNVSWYYKYICNSIEQGTDCGTFNRKHHYLKYFFTFEKSKLTKIKVHQ